VESFGASLDQARSNFKKANLPGKFMLRDLYQRRGITGLAELHADLWIVNPPRAGMKEALCEEAAKSKISELIYSSCNAQTLDRDVGILEKSGFAVTTIGAFDFFPRTPHIELVALLERKV
jgi:tRNA/tmRNA/rRNA uracil-C5-methylase (TrmA/RlmC/RlmD family)